MNVVSITPYPLWEYLPRKAGFRPAHILYHGFGTLVILPEDGACHLLPDEGSRLYYTCCAPADKGKPYGDHSISGLGFYF